MYRFLFPLLCASYSALAGPVKAKASVPAYHAAAMDGVAVKASDTFGALPEKPVILPHDAGRMVDTGDPVPEGKDAVVMIENVEHATGVTTMMTGYNLEDIAQGIDCTAERQPIGKPRHCMMRRFLGVSSPKPLTTGQVAKIWDRPHSMMMPEPI
jgi:hypothetical protein